MVAHVSNWLAVPHLIESQRDLIAVEPSLLATAYQRFDLKVMKPTFAIPDFCIYQFWRRRVNADPFSLWLRSQVRALFARGAPAPQASSACVPTAPRSLRAAPLAPELLY